MIALLLVTILCCIFFGAYYYSVRHFGYWRKRGVVFQKPVPFFGNIKDIATFRLTQAECLQNIYKEYDNEKYVGMFQLGMPTLLVRDPKYIRQFLVKDFQHFTDRGFTYDENKEPLTANLVNLEGVKWKLLRQKLTPTFSSGKIKTMVHLLHECGKQLVSYMQEILRKEDCVDMEIRELTAKFTTDVIGSCAFGLQFNSMCEKSSEFRRMGHKVLQPSKWMTFSKLLRVFCPFLFRLLNLRTFPQEVNNFFLSVVADTLQYRLKENVQRDDFLTLLLEIRNTSNNLNAEAEQEYHIELTDKLIAAQAFVFFLAGFETSSTTLSFCLHELAVNQHVQAEVVQEINNISKNYEQPFNYDALKEMNYLEQCLLETMRKYPPVQALARICTKPYTIPGTGINLDSGVALLIPVYAIHHDEQFYPNPEEFDPVRFSKENLNQKQNGIYMPFGDGPRICIGLRFAMMEMKLALATFLYRYKVTLCSKSMHPLKLDPTSFILSPKNGIWLNIAIRNPQSF